MAESALEKLLRLKRERAGEASAVGGADLSPNSLKVETPSQVLKEEPKEEVKEEPKEEPKKQMSAMEKLRAIKLGSSEVTNSGTETARIVPKVELKIEEKKDDIRSIHNQLSVSIHNVPTPELEKELDPPKPRKTHPLAMEMAELEAALDAEVPGFVNILSQIHKKLKADPECVTLLDDEEIGRIVAGLEKHTNVTIVSPNAVKAAKKAAKVPVTAADL